MATKSLVTTEQERVPIVATRRPDPEPPSTPGPTPPAIDWKTFVLVEWILAGGGVGG